MIKTNKKIEDILKRLNSLDAKGLQLVLDMITDLDKGYLYYKIKLLDKNNNVIQEEDIEDRPREYIDKYTDKYNIIPRLDFYNIINGKAVYQPTLKEREDAKKLQQV